MWTDNNEEPVIDPAPAPERQPGHELACAREQAGIGLRTMADTLHLPENQLRALESDDYDSLPPPTFVRGYLRSYARVLGLDDDDIVAAYDAVGSAADDPRLRLSGGREVTAHRRGIALSLTALALVVAVSLGGWWWQSRATGSAPGMTATESDGAASSEPPESAADEAADRGDSLPDENATAEAVAEASERSDSPTAADSAGAAGREASQPGLAVAELEQEVASSERVAEPRSEQTREATDESGEAAAGQTSDADNPEASAGTSEGAAGTQQADADQVSAEVTAADASTAGQADNAAPADAADSAAAESSDASASYEPPAATASADEASSPQAAEGPERLQLNLDGRSWIEIYDARGRELVYTLYSGSEPLELRGWPPFDVFLGNSPAADVEFNGSAVGKSAFTRSDNTARFLVDGDGARRR